MITLNKTKVEKVNVGGPDILVHKKIAKSFDVKNRLMVEYSVMHIANISNLIRLPILLKTEEVLFHDNFK